MGATLCLWCWACLTACLPSVVPMACWSSKYSAGLPPFERTSRLSTRCGFSGVRIVSSGAIHHSKCRMMQACFALVPQDNAVRSSDLRVFGLLPFAARFLGGFWVFNGSQEISISTFGHLNVCRQSRRADCGLPYACLRSSAACSFCGVLRVLDGFVLKCPKVETMYLDGVKIPGSVNFGGARSPFCGAPGPFFVVCGVRFVRARHRRALPAGGATIIFACGGRRVNIPVGSEEKKTPRRAPCMQISSQEGERRVCDASALRSGPPCRT